MVGKELFLEMIKDKYELLTEFKGMREKLELKCLKCGNVFISQPRYFTNNDVSHERTGKCKVCIPDPRSRKNEFMEYFNNVEGYTLLNDYKNYRTRIKIRHEPCGTVYEIFPGKFKNKGQRCKLCRDEEQRNSDEFVTFVEKEGYTMVSKYKNNKTKVKLKHNECGRVELIIPIHFMFANRRCLYCGDGMSNGERTILKFLEDNKYYFKKEKSFSDLKHKNRLRFDFYIYDDKNFCLVEYNGQQHYRPVDFFGGQKGFEEIIFRDGLKKEYCENKNIPLITIPYTEKNIEKFLKNELDKLGITNSLNT